MAEPLREQALAAIVTTLQGMTGTRYWGGAYPNTPTVERVYRALTQINKHPHLCVLEASGSHLHRIAEGDDGGGGGGQFFDEFRVMIYGYVAADLTTGRSTWLQRLQQDVKRTLIGTHTLGGIVRTLVPDAGEETDEGELEPKGAFAQGFTVFIDEVIAEP